MKIKLKHTLQNVKYVFTDEKHLHRIIFSLLDTFSKENLPNLTDNTIESKYYPINPVQHQYNYILFIALVSFHQKKGTIIETTFPNQQQILSDNELFFSNLLPLTPLPNQTNQDKLDNILNQLTYLCLPDGIHSVEQDVETFFISNYNKLIYCTYAYQQIRTNKMQVEDSFQINQRNCIQKALCIVSTQPIIFSLYKQLSTTMNNYMTQHNLDNKKYLESFRSDINGDECYNALNISYFKDYYKYFSYKNVIKFLHKDTFTLIKLLLLEKKIIVYSHVPYKVNHFMLCVLSLLPLQLIFGLSHDKDKFKDVYNYKLSLNDYGFPFKIFHDDNLFFPMFTLYDIDFLIQKKPKGFFIGTSNNLILENRAITKDVLINIDENVFEIVNEDLKRNNQAIKTTENEKNLYNEWLLMFDIDNQRKKSKTRIRTDDDVTWLNYNLTENEIQQNEKMIMQLKNYFMKFISDFSFGIEVSMNDTNKINIDNNSSINLELDKEYAESNSMFIGGQKNTNDNKLTLSEKLECTSFAYFLTLSHKYNIYFINEWIQTNNFKLWLKSYNKSIAYLSEFSTGVRDVLIHYENGDVYNGKMNRGLKEHTGNYFYYKSNQIYAGEYKDDKKHGKGSLVSAKNKFCYEGEWENDKMNGIGTLQNQQLKYVGRFMDNLFEGKGQLIDDKGNTYAGLFKKGKKWGTGKFRLANGDVYEGEFVDDLYEGHGKLTTKDGDIYKGMFIKGMLNGKVLIEEKNKNRIYLGNFLDGVKDGKWIVNDKYGKKIKEEYWVKGIQKK